MLRSSNLDINVSLLSFSYEKIKGLFPFQESSSNVQLVELDDSEATLLQLDVDKPDDNKSELEKGVVEISLYALLGSPSRGTMRMRGKINGHWITILIDIGSTHNFLDTAILVVLQLSLDLTLTFEVKVANGATI